MRRSPGQAGRSADHGVEVGEQHAHDPDVAVEARAEVPFVKEGEVRLAGINVTCEQATGQARKQAGRQVGRQAGRQTCTPTSGGERIGGKERGTRGDGRWIGQTGVRGGR